MAWISGARLRITVAATIMAMGSTLVVAVPSWATGADHSAMIDQQPVQSGGAARPCDVSAYPGGKLVNTGSVPGLGLRGTTQTFVPSIGNVTSIDLCLTPVLGGGLLGGVLGGTALSGPFTFTVAIYRADGGVSPDGEVTRTTATLSLADAASDLTLSGASWFNVSLADANLSPGVPYAIEISQASLSFVWRTTCGGDLLAPACTETSFDAYPEGQAIGIHARSDHGFRTHYVAGADLTVRSVGVPDLACPDLSTFSELSYTVQNNLLESTAATQVELHAVDAEGTTINLGRAPVPMLLGGQAAALPLSAFTNSAAMATAKGVGSLALDATVDPDNLVVEVDEGNNVASSSLPFIPCETGRLVDPTLAVAGDAPGAGADIRHGITTMPYSQLTPEEIALGGRDFGRQSNVITAQDLGDPNASPILASPILASPILASPTDPDPVFASPILASPILASPILASPILASPILASPILASPILASPILASPILASPILASPILASRIDILFGSVPVEYLELFPISAIATNVDIEALLAAHPEGAALLEQTIQNVTLADLVRLDPPLALSASDLDLSRVASLNPVNFGLANVRLGDLPYEAIPGADGSCDFLSGTTFVTCDDVAEQFGSVDAVTMLALSLFKGADVASMPIGSVPLGDITVRPDAGGKTGNLLLDLPLATTELDDLGLDRGFFRLFPTPYGSRTVAEVIDQAKIDQVIDCDRLARQCQDMLIHEVESAFAFRAGVDVRALVEASTPLGQSLATIANMSTGILGHESFPWGNFDWDPIHVPSMLARTGQACPSLPLTLRASVGADAEGHRWPVVDPSARLMLPRGFDLVRGSARASIDDGPVGEDVITGVTEVPYATTDMTEIRVTLDGIVTDKIFVTLEVCASDTLGAFPVSLDGVGWLTFVDDGDGGVELASLANERTAADAGRVVDLRVVEDHEPDEARPNGDTITHLGAVVNRHIFNRDGEGRDVDQFVIPPVLTVGDLDGDGSPDQVPVEAGDVVNVYLAPPKAHLEVDPLSGVATAVGGLDLDMGLFVRGLSSEIESFFGPAGSPILASALVEPGIRGRQTAVANGGPSSSLAPSPILASPILASPILASPILASPILASPYDAPARMVSNNRGDRIEHVYTQVRPGEEGSDLVVEVASVFGDSDERSYRIWVTLQKAPPRLACTPIFEEADLGATPAGGMPSLAPGDETLILFNPTVAAAVYPGDNNLNALGMQLRALADDDWFESDDARVRGVVVDPMADPDYDAALRNWLTTPDWCRPEAANVVAGHARRIVQQAANQTIGPDGKPTLKNVLIVFGDEVHPFGRAVDSTPIANQTAIAQQLFSRTQTLNPLSAAALEGYYITDDMLGTSQVRLYDDHPIYLPTQAVGRLYGSPTTVLTQLAAFASANGRFEIGDGDALVVGEEAFADGAGLTADDLELLGYRVDRSNLNAPGATAQDLSDIDDLKASLGATPSLAATMIHTDMFRIQSAYGTATRNADVLSTQDVLDARIDPSVGDLTFGRVLAGTNCNFGMDVPFAYFGDGTTPVASWQQVLAGDGNNIAAALSTAFGYGVSLGSDLTEELVRLTSFYAARGFTFGEAVVAAKEQVYASRSEYGDYVKKALETFQPSGLFMAVASDPVAYEEPTVIVPQIRRNDARTGGLDVAVLEAPDLAISSTTDCTECLARIEVAEGSDTGTYYRAMTTNSFGGVEGTGSSPLVPTTTTVYDLGGETVGGVLITGIESAYAEGVAGDPSSIEDVNFVHATTQVSGGGLLGPGNGIDVHTPGVKPNVRSIDGLTHVTHGRAVAKGISARPDGQAVGSYRLDTRVRGELILRDPEATSWRPPTTGRFTVTKALSETSTSSTITLEWEATDTQAMVRAVGGALVDGTWHFGEAQLVTSATFPAGSADGTMVTTSTYRVSFGGLSPDAAVDTAIQQTVDRDGDVGWSRTKSTPLVGDGDPDVVGQPPTDGFPKVVVLPGPGGIGPNGAYIDEAIVHIDGKEGQSYVVRVDGGQPIIVDADFTTTISGSGPHTVSAADRFGLEGDNQTIIIDAAAPTIRFVTPTDPLEAGPGTRVFASGTVVDISVLCDDDLGIRLSQGCVVSGDTLGGAGQQLDTASVTAPGSPRHVVVTATDVAGRVSVRSVDYTVISGYVFTAFDSPLVGDFVVDPDSGAVLQWQTYQAGGDNTIPFKFRVFRRSGQAVTDLLPASAFTWTRLVNGVPSGEFCQAASKPGYKYSSGKHHFNASTECPKPSGGKRDHLSGEVWRFAVTLGDGTTLFADVTYS